MESSITSSAPTSNCSDAYIGESGRSFGDRIKEHLKALSPVHQHSSTTGHPVHPDCFRAIDREVQGKTRTIKEAMFIRVNDPMLNANLGKYQLPHIWDNILKDTPMLIQNNPAPPMSPNWHHFFLSHPPPHHYTPTHQLRWGCMYFFLW